MELTSYDKAITGGIVTAIVALLARYGVASGPQTITVLGFIVTAVVSYVVGHVAVFLAKNKIVA